MKVLQPALLPRGPEKQKALGECLPAWGEQGLQAEVCAADITQLVACLACTMSWSYPRHSIEQAWWHIPTIPTLERWKFKVTLG